VYKHRAAISLRAIAATGVLSAAFSIATSWAAAKVLGVSTGEAAVGRVGFLCHCCFNMAAVLCGLGSSMRVCLAAAAPAGSTGELTGQAAMSKVLAVLTV
jgi:hypothetical protein